ncbi:hypothetical protein CI610_02752 [invertebrate metagenome]|uniref:Uncharacterized protein n=1 Tax=invertebrate metagenome TaxID=1711999 RepID=A0A2H9T535_9ZZZZ
MSLLRSFQEVIVLGDSSTVRQIRYYLYGGELLLK